MYLHILCPFLARLVSCIALLFASNTALGVRVATAMDDHADNRGGRLQKQGLATAWWLNLPPLHRLQMARVPTAMLRILARTPT